MALGHERMDVYRLAIAYVAWGYEKAATACDGNHSIPIPIPIAIAISMRPSPNKAVEATGYRRLTADDGYVRRACAWKGDLITLREPQSPPPLLPPTGSHRAAGGVISGSRVTRRMSAARCWSGVCPRSRGSLPSARTTG